MASHRTLSGHPPAPTFRFDGDGLPPPPCHHVMPTPRLLQWADPATKAAQTIECKLKCTMGAAGGASAAHTVQAPHGSAGSVPAGDHAGGHTRPLGRPGDATGDGDGSPQRPLVTGGGSIGGAGGDGGVGHDSPACTQATEEKVALAVRSGLGCGALRSSEGAGSLTAGGALPERALSPSASAARREHAPQHASVASPAGRAATDRQGVRGAGGGASGGGGSGADLVTRSEASAAVCADAALLPSAAHVERAVPEPTRLLPAEWDLVDPHLPLPQTHLSAATTPPSSAHYTDAARGTGLEGVEGLEGGRPCSGPGGAGSVASVAASRGGADAWADAVDTTTGQAASAHGEGKRGGSDGGHLELRDGIPEAEATIARLRRALERSQRAEREALRQRDEALARAGKAESAQGAPGSTSAARGGGLRQPLRRVRDMPVIAVLVAMALVIGFLSLRLAAQTSVGPRSCAPSTAGGIVQGGPDTRGLVGQDALLRTRDASCADHRSGEAAACRAASEESWNAAEDGGTGVRLDSGQGTQDGTSGDAAANPLGP
mmetsp:Transcript_12172/g.36278  ORF Transcript_12172/g.36278 Transcript_12172/m.36278 type:complete len:548 (+) Transcript_12172:432-2075(+)